EQRVRPVMPRAEDVPGTQDRGIQAAGANHGFALLSNRNVGLHHRRGMGDANVDKVTNAPPARRCHGFPASHQVDAAELGCLGGAGMSHSDQLDESRGGLHPIAVTIGIQRVPLHQSAPRRHLRLGFRAHEGSHPVTTPLQSRDEPAPDVTAASSDEYMLSDVSHCISVDFYNSSTRTCSARIARTRTKTKVPCPNGSRMLGCAP